MWHNSTAVVFLQQRVTCCAGPAEDPGGGLGATRFGEVSGRAFEGLTPASGTSGFRGTCCDLTGSGGRASACRSGTRFA